MRKRTIQDCERDVKGIHQMKLVMLLKNGSIYWCHACGALATENRDKKGLAQFTVYQRVQE